MRALLLLLLLAAPAAAEVQPAPVVVTRGTSNIGTVSGSTVTVLQGTNPWNITGSTIIVTVASDITLTTSTANIGTVSGSSVTAFQGGGPWDVSGSTIIVSGGLVLSTGAHNVGTVTGSSVAAAQLGSFTVTPGTGTFPVSAASLPLPAGAASEATQVAVSTTLAAVKARADLLATEATLAAFKALLSTGPAGVLVDASGATVPVSAASLPLPAGAATEATLGTLFQAGQNIGNTAFGAAQIGSYTTTPGTGTASVSAQGSVTVTPGTGTWASAQAGSFTVTPGTGTWPVSGSFFQAVQPVSAVGSVTVTPGTGTVQAAVQGGVTVTPGTGTWSAAQAGSYTVTPGTGAFPAAQQGSVTVTPGTGTFAVSGAVGAAQLGSYTVTPGTGTFNVNVLSQSSQSVSGSSVTAIVTGPEADGVTSTTFPIQMGGVDSSGKVQAAFTDVSGRLKIIVDSGTIAAIPGRPTEDSNRVYVSSAGSNLTGNNVFYTVTAGKTLYVTTIVLSGVNTNTTVNGNLEVRDNTVDRLPLLIPNEGSGLGVSVEVKGAAISASFPEPLQFTTNIRVNIIAGAVTYNFMFNGYEE